MDTNNENKKTPNIRKTSNIRHFEPRGQSKRRPHISSGAAASVQIKPEAVSADAQKTAQNTEAPVQVTKKETSSVKEIKEAKANCEKKTEAQKVSENKDFQQQNNESGKNRHRRRNKHHRSEDEKNATQAQADKQKTKSESQKSAQKPPRTNKAESENEDIVSNSPIEKATTDTLSEVIVKSSDVAEIAAAVVENEVQPLRDELIEIIGVRFKQSGKVYYFSPNGLSIEAGMNVIVETARGIEYGSVAIGNKQVELREIVPPLRNTIRVATPEDDAHYAENADKEKKAFDICLEKIEKHKLDMKLINVEYTFDNNKLLFYFTADSRIDFRELVKDLASIFRTRIELRQIGIRDEAKMIGGLGLCGRPFCCKAFLNDFVQVSIKMAKEQNMSLNSAKISGACGRLMCCLRYEYDTYDDELRRTPKLDSIVQTPDGEGIVVEVMPLEEKVKVRMNKSPELPPKTYSRDDVRVKGFAKQEKNDLSDAEMKELKALEDR